MPDRTTRTAQDIIDEMSPLLFELKQIVDRRREKREQQKD
jgi:hypothetical protein